jgi:hypothetical protein
MKKNWLVTLAGIMAALGGVPILVASSGVATPAWWGHLAFPFILIGIIGSCLLGWAAKGEDEHSTQAQVTTSTKEVTAAAIASVNKL